MKLFNSDYRSDSEIALLSCDLPNSEVSCLETKNFNLEPGTLEKGGREVNAFGVRKGKVRYQATYFLCEKDKFWMMIF